MLGEKPHLEPVVLERQVLVRLVELLVVQDVLHRIWVDASLRTLVDAPGVEERRLVVSARRIRRKDDRIFSEKNLSCLCKAGEKNRKNKYRIFHVTYFITFLHVDCIRLDIFFICFRATARLAPAGNA